MATRDVRMPDGTIIRGVPDGTTKAQLLAKVNGASRLGLGQREKAGIGTLFKQGFVYGLGDEAEGIASVLSNAIRAPFDRNVDFKPVQAYKEGKRQALEAFAKVRQEHPYAGVAAELAGGLASNPFGAPERAATLLGTVKNTAKAGAKAGALAGFGYGEGASGSAAGTALGAGLGAVTGAALPIAGRLVSRPITAARNYLRPQAGVGRQLVVNAITDDGLSPRVAGEAMDAANGRGVPIMLGDLGENLRGLTGAVSRQPGPSRRLVRAAVNQRQMEQADRVQGALARDLGPTTYVPQAADDITARARAKAAPLYEEAYARPVVSTPELDAILGTPAGRGALGRARTIAANERRDPEALGFRLDDKGNVALEPTVNLMEDEAGNLVLSQSPSKVRGYTTQTLDFIKRGLDDILEEKRDPLTRKLVLDESGRAINQVRAQLVREVDRLNPAYPKARAAYQGEASQREALELGKKALMASADDLARMMKPLKPAELEQFALGLRSAMSENLGRSTDGADKVGRLLGTPRKRAALARAFGGRANFDRFVQTMADERMANETYRAVSTGSMTASNRAMDEAVSDQSLLEDVAGKALKGASNGGLTGMVAEVVTALKDLNKFGAGATGQRAREEAAALLSEIDPETLRQAMRQAMRNQALRRVQTRSVNQTTARIGQRVGQAAGAVAGANMEPTRR